VDSVNIEGERTMVSKKRILKEVQKAWAASAALTATTGLMLVAFVASLAGMFLDDRIIAGAPAWLKPAKFAISTAIFCATMAWLYRYINVWPRFLRALGWVLSTVLVVEVAIVDVQAARGATSHFNLSTAIDGVLFGVMGVSIAVLWVASIGVLIALFRQKFPDPAWGWWLRMGMLITVVGSAAGGLMVRMTPEQVGALRAGHSISTVGAHSVGGPDGGPGLAGLGWSTQHGDLRVAHFFGLHGVQIIPWLGWLVLRRQGHRGDPRQSSLAIGVAASYLAFVGILAWQALRGQSIISPDAATFLALAIWLVVTAVAVITLRGANQVIAIKNSYNVSHGLQYRRSEKQTTGTDSGGRRGEESCHHPSWQAGGAVDSGACGTSPGATG
jgi:hypothetical protein